MHDISVLIVNWNTRTLLRQCLSSIHGSKSLLKPQTIVVDNNSDDGSADMVSREFPTVQLIRNKSNLGFAKACNQAIRLSTGRYLLLLNSDTEVCDRSLDEMTSFLDENERVGAVGCSLLNSDGSLQRSYWHSFPSTKDSAVENLFLYKLSRRRRRSGRDRSLPGEDAAIDVAHLLGACVMFRRKALENVGLLDEGYFMYLEETDWFYRAKEKGWRICYLPSVEVVHHGQQSSNLDPVRVVPYLSESHCRFVRKHYGNKSILFIKVAYVSGAVLRVCLWAKRWLCGPDRPLAPKMIKAYSIVIGKIFRV